MNATAATIACDARCTLGEGPVWWDDALWFVDIEGRSIHRFDPFSNEHRVHYTGARTGFAVPSRTHGWLIGQDASITAWTPSGEASTVLAEVEPPSFGTRMNDAKCDPHGRLYAGTMHLSAEPDAGALYRMDADHTPRRIVSDLTISNGMAWDEAAGAMYFIDTATRRIDRFQWDPRTGDINGRAPVAELQDGSPDGMCIDEDGLLWVAMWGGSRVARVDPVLGEEIGAVHLPCPNVTSCCFGGPSMRQLWITTARLGMNKDALDACPEAGGVFVTETGTRGSETTPAM
ncbi:MAG: SMP-30/gluconolactonase/LRE family protein [Planctomycetota bacterium]